MLLPRTLTHKYFLNSQFGKGWPSGIFFTCGTENNIIISSFLRKQHISHVGTKAEIPRWDTHGKACVCCHPVTCQRGFLLLLLPPLPNPEKRTDIDRSDHDRIPMQTQLEAGQQVVTQQQHGIIRRVDVAPARLSRKYFKAWFFWSSRVLGFRVHHPFWDP